MTEVVVSGDPLLPDDVVAVAQRRAVAVPGPGLAERMLPAREVVARVLADNRTVYGITTGFGALASTRIDPAQAAELQLALVRSHAAGVGEPVGPELVRAMMLLRARTLAQGHSGVRPLVVERILELMRRDLLPVVPAQGSVGASGDLAPFAHLALPLIGEGELSDGGVAAPAADVLARHGLEPLRLEPKEGLSLLNGTEGMLAMGVLGLAVADSLAITADAACALSIEALLGSSRPLDPRIHRLRPHPGQARSAALMAALLEGSGINSSHADDFEHAVQDAYSLRCAPQVHGAVADTLGYARAVFERELGAVVDNPLVFADDDDVLSGGNFHGQPLAFALDFMAIAVAELGSIAERRTDRILDPDRSSGLPPFLAARPGLTSGYMIAQYTAAALVAENRILAHPASVDSVPTSGLQEDHVSMGWGAGRKLGDVLDNVAHVLAIELICAAEGVDHRAPLRPAPGTAAIHALVRSMVPPLADDRPPSPAIETVTAAVAAGDFAAAAEMYRPEG
ncbi:MAG: histidine ammonia-lyase [Acidimicrobiia bacterium]|nr:histidine ammonia-lyase [Acidimicrobiia bacterium]